MQHTLLGIAARLTDDELLQRIQILARAERDATVELVAHLAELDVRRLYLERGYGSLFSYCTEAMRLAEHAAYNRIEAARASRKFPAILDRLADGSLNLSTVRLLAPHLTPENHLSILDEAARKSKREVESLVARLAPRPDAPAFVRKLPPSRLPMAAPAASSSLTTRADVTTGDAAALATVVPVSGVGVTPRTVGSPVDVQVASTSGSFAEAGAEVTSLRGSPALLRVPLSGPRSSPAPPPATPEGRAVIAPLSSERYRVQFTVGRDTHEKLRRAQELLRREVPDGDPGAIFDRALKLLLDDVARKKLAATCRPRPVRATAERSRHVPAHVKRAVWLRDGGECAFVARSGRRCRERAFLEFHHVDPYAIGGETTTANLSLRCRAHNVHEAERLFGLFVPVAGGGIRRGGARVATATRPGAS